MPALQYARYSICVSDRVLIARATLQGSDHRRIHLMCDDHADMLSWMQVLRTASESKGDVNRGVSKDQWRLFALVHLAPPNELGDAGAVPKFSLQNSATLRLPSALMHSSHSDVHASFKERGHSHSINDMLEFCILTSKDGANLGRSYYLKCEDTHQCAEWVAYLQRSIKQAVKRERDYNVYLRIKNAVSDVYNHELMQMVMAFVILLSFVNNVLEVQLDPGATKKQRPEQDLAFQHIDLAFTLVFLLELCVNLFVNWFRAFWQDLWNVFDFLVVGVSVISLFLSNLGSATSLRTIRLFRALRVLRLFRRLDAVKRIVEALSQSIVPVANAFIIILLIMCVYSIIGVQLFHDQAKGAFGTFSKALFTMFAASTMDGWQELITIPMIPEEDLWFSDTVPIDPLLIIFFVSFFLIVSWTLLPVVIAILLENFSEASNARYAADERAKYFTTGVDKMQHGLDPVLEMLSGYESDEDLKQRIEQLFRSLISDPDCQVLSAIDFTTSLGRKRFRNCNRVYLSQEDFSALTHNGALCDRNGCLTVESFEAIMRQELKTYIERQVSKELLMCSQTPSADTALLLAMKSLMSETAEISRRLKAVEASVACRSTEPGRAPVREEVTGRAYNGGDASGREEGGEEEEKEKEQFIQNLTLSHARQEEEEEETKPSLNCQELFRRGADAEGASVRASAAAVTLRQRAKPPAPPLVLSPSPTPQFCAISPSPVDRLPVLHSDGGGGGGEAAPAHMGEVLRVLHVSHDDLAENEAASVKGQSSNGAAGMVEGTRVSGGLGFLR